MIPEDKITLEAGVFFIDQTEEESELKLEAGDRVRFHYQGEQYIGKVDRTIQDPNIIPIKEHRKL